MTGSLNAGLAQWLIGSGVMPARYVASQGTAMGTRRLRARRAAATATSGSAATASRWSRARFAVSWAVDHLVIGAATLARARRGAKRRRIAPARAANAPMGTHNRLLSLAGEAFRAAYLRSSRSTRRADPAARRRWFDLDDAGDAGALPRARA